MRHLILGGIVAASLGAPALPFAAPTTGRRAQQPSQQPRAGTLGGGMQGGNEPYAPEQEPQADALGL